MARICKVRLGISPSFQTECPAYFLWHDAEIIKAFHRAVIEELLERFAVKLAGHIDLPQSYAAFMSRQTQDALFIP